MIFGNEVEVDYTFNDLSKISLDGCELKNLQEHSIKYYPSEFSAFRILMQKQDVDLIVKKCLTILRGLVNKKRHKRI